VATDQTVAAIMLSEKEMQETDRYAESMLACQTRDLPPTVGMFWDDAEGKGGKVVQSTGPMA
jgi:hypothetical protein